MVPMTRLIKWLLLVVAFLLNPLFGREAQANTINAVSCNTRDVQTAINSAAEGDTVIIPAGTCTWTTGVTVIGKGIVIKGAGSGRIIAINQDVLTIATGPLFIATVQSARVDGTYPLGPTAGQTLRVFQVCNRQNWMQGTVTSFDSSTGALVMNVTSTSGTVASVQQHHWAISTLPSTSISNSATQPLFHVTEDTSVHTNISGIKFLQGTTLSPSAEYVYINPASPYSAGQAVLIHDCWMESGSGLASIEAFANRGVVWNSSFDATPYAKGGPVGSVLNVSLGDANGLAGVSWTTPSLWGASDTTGQGNFYFETNDVHGYLVQDGTDAGGRLVHRYNFMDNDGFANHGADSGPYGQRYYEYYNNVGIFTDYSDGHSTLPIANGWIFNRGGTFVVHDNVLPVLDGGSDLGHQNDIVMTVMQLQRNAGPDPCWGAGTSGGADYPVPRQTGFGYVTGLGHAPISPPGETSDSVTYVGDSEPVYIWNNRRSLGGAIVPLTVTVEDYGLTNPDSCKSSTYDTSAKYIVLNRDYFNGTPKPGYTPYTYPHPLTSVESSGPPPPPPLGVTVTSVQ
jgi:hypothetical protein